MTKDAAASAPGAWPGPPGVDKVLAQSRQEGVTERANAWPKVL